MWCLLDVCVALPGICVMVSVVSLMLSSVFLTLFCVCADAFLMLTDFGMKMPRPDTLKYGSSIAITERKEMLTNE